MTSKTDPYEKVFRDIGFDKKQFTREAPLQFSVTYTPEGKQQPKHAGTLLKKITYFNPRTGMQFDDEYVNLFTQAFTYTVLSDIYAKGSEGSLKHMNLEYIISYNKYSSGDVQSNNVQHNFPKEIHDITKTYMSMLSLDTRDEIKKAVELTTTRAQYLIGKFFTDDENHEALLKTNILDLFVTLQNIYNKNTLLGNTTLTMCIQGLNCMTDLHGIRGNDLLHSLNEHSKSVHFQPVYEIPQKIEDSWTKNEEDVFRRIGPGATIHSHSGLHKHFSATLYQSLVTSHGLKEKYKAAIEALKSKDSTHDLVKEYYGTPAQTATAAQPGSAPSRHRGVYQSKTQFDLDKALKDMGYPANV